MKFLLVPACVIFCLAFFIFIPSGSMLPEEPPSLASILPAKVRALRPDGPLISVIEDKSGTCALIDQGPVLAARELADKFVDLLPRPGDKCALEEGLVEKGETISGILTRGSEEDAEAYLKAAKKVFPLTSIRAGQPYAIQRHPDTGRLQRFVYEINSDRCLIVEGTENPRARLDRIQYTTTLEAVSGKIEDNLFQAVADAGEGPQLALRLVELFGSEINFIKDIQSGDAFSVVIEKKSRKGEFRGYGRILAASFTNKGKTWEAFLFADGSGKGGYYNEKGESLKKTLLQAPLAVTRMTSRFTHSRKHPILGFSRPHLGVDYGAPTGTPVKAVGSGTVTKRGWAGGYGNQIIIRHDAGLESMYSHLSGFVAGLKQGQKVRQGQIIGYVGSTGLSTGPHLDFRLRQNGNFINPAKAVNPRGAPVNVSKMAAFNKIVQKEREWLQRKNLPVVYTLDSVVPLPVSLEKEKGSEKPKNGVRIFKKPKVKRRS